MSSEIEMSLEDIIKKRNVSGKKKIAGARNGLKSQTQLKGPQLQTRKSQPGPTQRLNRTLDARNKIILKKRTQIIDARDKLAELSRQKDARIKLEQLRLKKASLTHSIGRKMNLSMGAVSKFQGRGFPQLPFTKHDRVFMDASRQVKSQPLTSPSKINLSRQIGYSKGETHSKRENRIGPLKPIMRTVENDIIIPRPIVVEDDYDDIMRLPVHPMKKSSLNIKIVTHNDAARERSANSFRKEKERSPPMPPSILKKRPLSLMSELKTEKSDSPTPTEYRIIVSNLKNTVTGGDIQELFGDVGGMVESRLVRPGTAEVMYRSLEDAQRAVDLYHNRQLDGQPMNCLLVNPRPNTRPGTGSKTPLPASTSSSVVPDISTFHKVLFSR